jgi:hypothetical protein
LSVSGSRMFLSVRLIGENGTIATDRNVCAPVTLNLRPGFAATNGCPELRRTFLQENWENSQMTRHLPAVMMAKVGWYCSEAMGPSDCLPPSLVARCGHNRQDESVRFSSTVEVRIDSTRGEWSSRNDSPAVTVNRWAVRIYWSGVRHFLRSTFRGEGVSESPSCGIVERSVANKPSPRIALIEVSLIPFSRGYDQ